MEPSKVCTLCKKLKPLTEFRRKGGKRGDQLRSRCKPCDSIGANERNNKWRANNLERAKKKEKERRIRNKDQINQQQRDWYSRNIEKVALRNKKRYEKDKHRHAAGAMKRKAKKLNQLPLMQWEIEKDKIFEVYAFAARLNKIFNTHYEIDHIIPLSPCNPKAPRGLHVLANLQILPFDLNVYKSNKVNF